MFSLSLHNPLQTYIKPTHYNHHGQISIVRALHRSIAAVHSMSSSNTMVEHRRYAVLKAGHSTAYIEREHGGYAHMLARLLPDEQEKESWEIFHVVDGDFSFADSVDEFDGFVITGSAADAHDESTSWINRLVGVIEDLHARKKKILGICFGHQILARALGGKTGRAAVGWEVGVKTLNIDAEKIKAFYGLELPSKLNAIQSHRDQVSLVPPGAVVLASSEKTDVEMFALGNHILGIQCHPEFSKDVMLDIIRSRIAAKAISDEVANEGTESFENKVLNHEPLKTLCKRFLKG